MKLYTLLVQAPHAPHQHLGPCLLIFPIVHLARRPAAALAVGAARQPFDRSGDSGGADAAGYQADAGGWALSGG